MFGYKFSRPARAIAILLSLFSLDQSPSVAEAIAIPRNSAVGNPPNETLVMYWQADNPLATLVLIPGGEGRVNLSPSQKSLNNQFYRSVKMLSDKAQSKGNINVVVFDNPYDMPSNPSSYPDTRASIDHLSRIESVVQFFKKRTGKPVLLMGHSNGAVSVTEYIRYINKAGKSNSVQGIILSSSRNGSYIDSRMSTKALVLHHSKDACRNSTSDASNNLYNSIRRHNGARTEMKNLESGISEGGNPCRGGFHMFNGGGQELSKAIEGFILRN